MLCSFLDSFDTLPRSPCNLPCNLPYKIPPCCIRRRYSVMSSCADTRYRVYHWYRRHIGCCLNIEYNRLDIYGTSFLRHSIHPRRQYRLCQSIHQCDSDPPDIFRSLLYNTLVETDSRLYIPLCTNLHLYHRCHLNTLVDMSFDNQAQSIQSYTNCNYFHWNISHNSRDMLCNHSRFCNSHVCSPTNIYQYLCRKGCLCSQGGSFCHSKSHDVQVRIQCNCYRPHSLYTGICMCPNTCLHVAHPYIYRIYLN